MSLVAGLTGANAFSAVEGDKPACATSFANLVIPKLKDDFEHAVVHKTEKGEYRAGLYLITGDPVYPSAMIRDSLGLTDEVLNRLPSNANILSVGEGQSELIPQLKRRFPNARGLDLWYDSKNLPNTLQRYVDEHRDNLIAGSATKLPVPDQSQKLVVSHMMINNFKEAANVKKALDEMIRVLAPGGEARITYTNAGVTLLEQLEELRAKYGRIISFRVETTHVEWTRSASYTSEHREADIRRITIRRADRTDAP